MKRTAKACACPEKKASRRSNFSFSLLGGIIVAILPKCPFCVLAYSSAITVCGSSQLHATSWASWISIVFSLITLGIVLYNYKGTRTLIAAAVITVALILIGWAELRSGSLSVYYWGAGLLVIGVWVNGSFFHFLKKWIRSFQGRSLFKQQRYHVEPLTKE